MALQLAIKDHIRESRLFTNRAVVALAMVIVTLLVITGWLLNLQILSHEHYTTLSHNNRVSIVPLEPTRGLIYDRNGVVLAQNLPTFTLELIPEQIDDLLATIAGLTDLISFSDYDLSRF